MEQVYQCPNCGTLLEIIQCTDWDALATYFYPQCPLCGFTTRETFDNKTMLFDYLHLTYDKKENSK